MFESQLGNICLSSSCATQGQHAVTYTSYQNIPIYRKVRRAALKVNTISERFPHIHSSSCFHLIYEKLRNVQQRFRYAVISQL